jgi:hypothetical protein
MFLFYLFIFFCAGFCRKIKHVVFGNGLILKCVNMERGSRPFAGIACKFDSRSRPLSYNG